MRVAAIDIGTNTVRVIVVDDGQTIDRDSRITRLGEGVDAAGELGDAPVRRTLDVVREFVSRARSKGAERVRIAGTSAVRDARNRADFAQAVEAATGIELEILSGEEEGRIAYAGATSWLDDGRYVVCDIGGGSTEFITDGEAISVDVGSVRVRERYLDGDPPSPGSVDRVGTAVREIFTTSGVSGMSGKLVGVAGTITTIAALDAGLSVYDSDVVHGHSLTAPRIARWAERLNTLTAEEIRALGPVDPGRADVIGAGALVLDAVVDVLRRDELLVSEHDILDGLAHDLLL